MRVKHPRRWTQPTQFQKMNENYKMVSQGIGQKLVYPQIQRDLPNH